jgi:hypothetical protein
MKWLCPYCATYVELGQTTCPVCGTTPAPPRPEFPPEGEGPVEPKTLPDAKALLGVRLKEVEAGKRLPARAGRCGCVLGFVAAVAGGLSSLVAAAVGAVAGSPVRPDAVVGGIVALVCSPLIALAVAGGFACVAFVIDLLVNGVTNFLDPRSRAVYRRINEGAFPPAKRPPPAPAPRTEETDHYSAGADALRRPEGGDQYKREDIQT